MNPTPPTLYQRALSRLFHCYPFLSGCGSVANNALANTLLPRIAKTVWARVGRYDCQVPLDDLVGRAIFLVGDLDRKVTWTINAVVEDGETVLDIGTNLGLVTLILAGRVGAQGRVLSFEPSPPVLAHLTSTLKRNHDLPIKLFQMGLGATPGTMTLAVPPSNAGTATLVGAKDISNSAHFEVEIGTLSSVLAAEKVEKVSLAKIDVEGFEAEVLKGLFCDSAAPLPQTILFEDHKPQASESIQLLKQNGYAIYGLPMRLLRMALVDENDPAFVGCHDFLAVHKTAPDHTFHKLSITRPN